MDARQCRIGKGGRTAALDWKGWTHSSAGWAWVGRTAVLDWKGLDAQHCRIEKGGRTAVRPCYSLFTNHYLLII
jgi:hypothetical protein